MTAEAKLIFVYGTLKRGGSNHVSLQGQKFVGDARTLPGYRLYDLGGYPGMVENKNSRETDDAGVTGEVWRVDAAALGELDRLEGLDEGLYRRVRIPLAPPFETQHIEAYLYARSVEALREIGRQWNV